MRIYFRKEKTNFENCLLLEQERPEVLGDTTQNSSMSSRFRLQIADERFLVRLVAARLDLAVSQRLLDHPFKLSIIKRCWEDQLRLKRK